MQPTQCENEGQCRNGEKLKDYTTHLFKLVEEEEIRLILLAEAEVEVGVEEGDGNLEGLRGELGP